MKIKKFLSMLLIGGMVVSSAPIHAMADISRRSFYNEIAPHCFRLGRVVKVKEKTLEDLCSLIRDADERNEEDLICIRDMEILLLRISYSSKNENIYKIVSKMMNICRAYSLYTRASFTEEEYKFFINDLLNDTSDSSVANSSSNLEIEIIEISKSLVKKLNTHAISMGLNVPKIAL